MKRYLVAAAALALALCLGPTIEPNAFGQKQEKGKIPEAKVGGQNKNLIAPFMGIKAAGQRFVIICDRSGSMYAGRVWWDYNLKKKVYGKKSSFEFLQEELEKTLRSLQGKGRFHITFYSTDIIDMPGDQWRGRTKEDTDEVLAWIKKLKPVGLTKPQQAFDIAFKLKPQPDVIFFMSDGIVKNPQGFYNHVMNLNRAYAKTAKNKKMIPVNTIQLTVPGTDIPSLVMSQYHPNPPPNSRSIERIKLILSNPIERKKLANKLQLQRRLMQALSKDTNGEFNEVRKLEQK